MLAPDWTIPHDGQNEFSGRPNKINQNPGPGDHIITAAHQKFEKTISCISLKAKFDNDVPGPGVHDPITHYNIPAFRIMKKQSFKRVPSFDKNAGPGEYRKAINYSNKGLRFGNLGRPEDHSSCKFTPGPAAYDLLGDFDFKPNTDAKVKNPEFYFGVILKVPESNTDYPRPAEYEVD